MSNSSRQPSLMTRFKRLFHAKNIVVVSQHAVDHYALSFKSQFALVVLVLVLVAGGSFSVGRYVDARKDLAKTERTLKFAKAEHHKMSSEFSLLKKDLIKMDESGEGLSSYAKFVIEQYEKAPESDINLDDPSTLPSDSTLMKRVDYLERELEREQFDKQQFMNTIHQLTRDKVKVLEEALKMTGMEDELSSVIDKKVRGALPKDTVQGGPFSPYNGEATSAELEHSLISEIAYLAEISNVMKQLPLGRPMRGARYTSGFGKRVDPFRRTLAMHSGIDYAGKFGSKVYATGGGKVIYAGYKGAYGKTIEIDHGYGITSRYAHLSRINVRSGKWVSVGQAIGVQGTTGRSTGHHLHYEIRYKGRAINPAKFVKAGQYVSKAKTTAEES